MKTRTGHRSAKFDARYPAIGLSPMFIEAKTGYRKYTKSLAKLYGTEEQLKKEKEIAKRCGLIFIVAVDNPIGAAMLRMHHIGYTIEHIPYGGGKWIPLPPEYLETPDGK